MSGDFENFQGMLLKSFSFLHTLVRSIEYFLQNIIYSIVNSFLMTSSTYSSVKQKVILSFNFKKKKNNQFKQPNRKKRILFF